jgi:hypothetical protein
VPSELSVARSVAPPELSIARSVPPDGSSFQQVQFQEKVATSIPPFGYLNLQFFHKVSMPASRLTKLYFKNIKPLKPLVMFAELNKICNITTCILDEDPQHKKYRRSGNGFGKLLWLLCCEFRMFYHRSGCENLASRILHNKWVAKLNLYYYCKIERSNYFSFRI